ncbi:SDR family NAD(P)-dependent oxidoreductase [Nonomuraea angiospora]|uniref:SDR family NAD(P)-dependent oxidoreductase n=1 Tax=Nonomuraea angiospora TaxID=46172 RepID=UPI0029BA583F|nr:SDR family oxidoreductase [Nonomuraea angiospora]MDX3106415.1 SDR family oxidoreductase [Nonomuraea angiospora]
MEDPQPAEVRGRRPHSLGHGRHWLRRPQGQAGHRRRLPVHELPEDDWDRQIAVSLKAAYLAAHVFCPLLAETRGSIVITSSVHARTGIPGCGPYAAAKGGLQSLAGQLAVEYAPDVRVNVVVPGPIMTAAWDGIGEQGRAATIAETPAGRFGRPDEVAAAVAFLASAEASFITGARDVLRPADLREAGIAMPDPAGAAEWRGYLVRLAGRLGVPLRFNAPAIGLRHLVEQFLAEKSAVGLGEMSIDPSGSGLRRIPIVEPTPLMPWSIVWHRRNPRPLLRALLRQLRPVSLPSDPGVWVPEIDLTPLGSSG